MAGTKYSQLEAKLTGHEDFGCHPKVRLRRFQHTFTSPCFTIALAFCVGVLAAFGGIRLFENVGKRDTDWLSESFECNTKSFGSETHKKWIGPPGDAKVQFEFNETYPGPPTMESEYAWLDLLPGKMTLKLTEEETLTDSRWSGRSPARRLDAIVTISVFHQLHCLVRFPVTSDRPCLPFADGPTTRRLR